MSTFSLLARTAPLLRKTTVSSTTLRLFSSIQTPTAPKPAAPEFSSGPCKKRPGYNLWNGNKINLGRSHRSKEGKATLKNAIEKTRTLLNIPDDYLIGIVPASDTGA